MNIDKHGRFILMIWLRCV